MNQGGQASVPLVAATVAFALLLTLIPLPPWMGMARPALFPATVLYWVLVQPGRYGVIVAWACGIFLDVADNNPIGQHGLALALGAFAVIKTKQILSALPLWQQGIAMVPVFGLYEFIMFWIDGVNGRSVGLLWRWLPVASTALVWPLWCLLLERLAAVEVRE